MPENNFKPYDRHRKEKGRDGKSLTAFHSHSRDFTCFGFQRGISQDLIVQVANREPPYTKAQMYVCLYMQELDMEFCQDWYLKITNYLTFYCGLSRLLCRFNYNTNEKVSTVTIFLGNTVQIVIFPFLFQLLYAFLISQTCYMPHTSQHT